MNGTAGTTSSNYKGVMEGQGMGPSVLTQDPYLQMQNLMMQIQNLLQEFNQFSSPAPLVPGLTYTPWSAPVYGHYNQWPPNTWNRIYRLSGLLGQVRSQIQILEDMITKKTYESIQGTVQGLNLAAQSLQVSQILRRMDSIINEIFGTNYQQHPGVS